MGTWERVARLPKPPGYPQTGTYGDVVALSGTTAFVGDLHGCSPAPGVDGTGCVLLFEKGATTWTPAGVLQPPRDINTGLGTSLASVPATDGTLGDGTTVAPAPALVFVGAPGGRRPSDGWRTGTVEVYARDAEGVWRLGTTLAPGPSAGNDEMATALGATHTPAGVLVAASAPFASSSGVSQAGVVYTFLRDSLRPALARAPCPAGVVYTFLRDPATGAWRELAHLEAAAPVFLGYMRSGRQIATSPQGLVVVAAPAARWDFSVGAAGDLLVFDVSGMFPVTSEAPPVAAGPGLRVSGANPARGATAVAFALAEAAPVRLRVLDALGREVAVVSDGVRSAVEHRDVLDVRGWPVGVYAVVLEAGARREVARVTVVR